MTSTKPWLVLGTLVSVVAGAYAAPDTSQWTCESCPVETGTSGSVDVGAAGVTTASPSFGDFTGLNKRGLYLDLGGSLRYLDKKGDFARVEASELGTDARSLNAAAGREGAYTVNFGYDELPRYFDAGAVTPFLGIGGSTLTLPAGYPAPTTAQMPLATLAPVDIGYERTRTNLGASFLEGRDWSFKVGASENRRNGTQPTSGSFFDTASQLVAPVHQHTDDIDVSAAYAGRGLQATLAYKLSDFRNDDAALTWTNPFASGTLGGTSGQLALPPDSQLSQLQGGLGWDIAAHWRASADLALGRTTQNAAFLAPTTNAALTLGALPANSLQGVVDTLNAGLRLTGNPMQGLTLNANLARNERDNHTPVLSWPSAATDLFVGPAYTNRPYSFRQDLLKLSADLRGSEGRRLTLGVDYDEIDRTYVEVASTREMSEYIRGTLRPLEGLSLSAKLLHAERRASDYQAVAWPSGMENPLMRHANLADRIRDSGSARADWTLSDSVSLGADLSMVADNYPDTLVGLTYNRSQGAGADLSWAVSDTTTIQVYGHVDWTRSKQAGSQQDGLPDWNAASEDASQMAGLGLRRTAFDGKLETGADIVITRSRSDLGVNSGAPAPGLPPTATAMDSVKLHASWKMRENLSLTGSWWYQHLDGQNWQLDGVLPGTIPSVLSFGAPTPRYTVNVLRLGMRYSF